MERKKVSKSTANREIRCLRAMFNYGKKKKRIKYNPLDEIELFPVDKRLKYVPPIDHVDKVISLAVQDTQDYLWTSSVRLTFE